LQRVALSPALSRKRERGPSVLACNRDDAIPARFRAQPPLARYAGGNRGGLLVGDGCRAAPGAPAGAVVGGLHPGRAARLGRASAARRRGCAAARAGLARLSPAPGAGLVLPAVSPVAATGKEAAPGRG